MKTLLLLFLFPLALCAQESTYVQKHYTVPNWDTATKWENRSGIGFGSLNPGQTAWAPYKAYYYGYFGSRGWNISNSLIRNFAQNPISLIADISLTHSSVYMSFFDTARKNNSIPRVGITKFHGLFLADLGIGAEIEGKYLFADIEYRMGYLGGGKTSDTAFGTPEIIRNGKLAYSRFYSGLQLALGFRYHGFHLRAGGNFPLDRFQVHIYKNWQCPLVVLSITAGYTFTLASSPAHRYGHPNPHTPPF